MGLAARFALWVSLALAIVMVAASFFLFERSKEHVAQHVERALTQAAQEQHSAAQSAARGEPHHRTTSQRAAMLEGDVMRMDVVIEEGPRKGQAATRYGVEGGPSVVVPKDRGRQESDLFALFAFVTGMVILVGAGVASLIALRVSQPLQGLVQDVRTIARGNLRHRTHVKASGEVRDLARAIDKMGESLAEAQGSEVQLGIRLRERELALELAQAFLPSEEPWIDGYRVQGRFEPSAEPGGGFFDYCQAEGRAIFFVCDVSGRGVPGSLIGATARAYLRTALQSEPDLAKALGWVNRELYRDVERGLFVTALVLVLDPLEHTAELACAGHKLPLLRFDASDGQLKSLQPNGFALGFDGGPVFDKRLEVIRIPFQPGDRVMLAVAGLASVAKENGQEWGEQGLYRTLAKFARLEPDLLVDKIVAAAHAFAGPGPQEDDMALLVLARDSA